MSIFEPRAQINSTVAGDGPETSSQLPQATGSIRPPDKGRWAKVDSEGFLKSYLSSKNAQSQSWSGVLSPLVETIKTSPCESGEEPLYTGDAPLLRLLNAVSWDVFYSLPNLALRPRPIVFRTCYDLDMHNPFNGSNCRPDVVALQEDDHISEWKNLLNLQHPLDFGCKQAPAWHHLVAAGEVKVANERRDNDALKQLEKYVRNHLHNRPDKSAALGIAIQTQGYELLYHDANVIHTSRFFEWANARPLCAFVERLYSDPFGDPSMVMLDANNPTPTWGIRVEDRIFVSENAMPCIGPGQRRFTGVARRIDNGDEYFFKDVWRARNGGSYEAALCNEAHEGEPLPGLMTIDSCGHVMDEREEPISTTSLGSNLGVPTPIRDKIRFFTLDVGQPLEKVGTVLQFLRVMYDVCAVQRNMYRKSDILHKDTSEGNIMIAPSDDEEFYRRCSGGFDKVKYINQLLAGDRHTKPKPACLLVDLGHGAKSKEMQNDPKNRAERTGTPKFMARSVSSIENLDFDQYRSDKVQMPRLDERALELYELAYRDGEYDRFTTLLTDRPPPDEEPEVTFTHQLFHDAESVFWVIAWVLATSTGPVYKKESVKNLPKKYRSFTIGMQEHQPFGDLDGRVIFKKAKDWKEVLHPDLESLAEMLARMGSYISPEWMFRPDLRDEPEHVHEALMRLLLKEIVRLSETKDIDLKVHNRVLPKPRIRRPAGVDSTSVYYAGASQSVGRAAKELKDDGAEKMDPVNPEQDNQRAEGEAPKVGVFKVTKPIDWLERARSELNEWKWPKLSYKLIPFCDSNGLPLVNVSERNSQAPRRGACASTSGGL